MTENEAKPSADKLSKKLQDYKEKYKHEKKRRKEENMLHRQMHSKQVSELEDSIIELRKKVDNNAANTLQGSTSPNRRPQRHSVVVMGAEKAGVEGLSLRQEALGAWERRLEEQETRLADRQEQLEEFEKEVDEIEGYLDRRKAICDRRDEELKGFHEELEVLQGELEDYRNNLLQIRDETDDPRRRAKLNCEGKDYLHASVMDTQSTVEVKLKKVKTELEIAQNKLAVKEQEVTSLNSQNDELKQQLDEKQNRIDELEQKLAKASVSHTSLSTPETPSIEHNGETRRGHSAPTSERSLQWSDTVDGAKLTDSFPPPVYRRQLHGKPKYRLQRKEPTFEYENSKVCSVM